LRISLGGRNRTRTGARRGLRPWWGTHPGRLAVRNAGARGTAIGIHHHAAGVDPGVGRPRPPHEGSGTRRRQNRQLRRSLFLGLDAHRAGRELDLLRNPFGARTVEPAMGSVSIVRVLLSIHIAAGGLAIVLGAVALLVRKGGTIHRLSGLLF